MESTPPGDALPPPPHRATPARKGAHCGAGAGSPRPHRPHPGHTGRGTPAARSRGRAAGGGTAPDTRRPSQRWQATPPGDGRPPPPRHAALTGRASQGDSVGPPWPHTRAHSLWVADPNSPPRGRAVGGGTAPDLRRPSQWWKAPPPGTPFRHPHSEQSRPARAHPVGPVLGPHARTDRTRDTRDAEPWLPAPEDGRPGEGQRLTPGAPHNGGKHPPRGRPSGIPTASNTSPQGRTPWGRCWVPTPASAAPGHTGRGTQAARSRGRAAGGGTVPDTRRPSQRWQASPPGDGPPPPPRHAAPTGHAGQGDSVGPPHPHTRAHSTRVADPNSPPRGRAVGGGTAPDPDAPHNGGRHPPRGRPSATPTASNASPQGRTLWGRCWVPTPAPTAPGTHGKRNPGCPLQRTSGLGRDSACHQAPLTTAIAPPPGTPFRHPRSEQRQPARAHTVGPVLGPHTRTDRTRDTRDAEPWLPAPEDGRTGEGQRLTPGAPHNGGRPPPGGRPPTTPAARSPHRACRPRGQCLAPTPTHPRPQHVGGGP